MKFCYPSAKHSSDVIITIIMYIYHALMDALSVHMIQIINLNPIFDTHSTCIARTLLMQFTQHYMKQKKKKNITKTKTNKKRNTTTTTKTEK